MIDRHIPSALRFMLAARRSELQGLEGLAQTCELVACVSQLVHALQRERGYSNLYLGSLAPGHLAQLRHLSAQAVEVQRTVEEHFQRIDLELASAADRARLFNRLAYVVHGLEELPSLRRRIGEQRIDATEATSAFTRLIGGLLAVVFEAADTALDPDITRLLVALFNFMQGKELAGQERAGGVAGFSRGWFDAHMRERMEHLIQTQARSFQVFGEFADDQARQQWRNQQAGDTAAQVARLRELALKTSETAKIDPGLSELWFELTTARIDAMREVESHLAGLLLDRCQRSIRQARHDLDNHRVLLNRLASLEGAGMAERAVLFNVQACELGSAPTDGLGPQLGRSVLELLQEQTRRLLNAHDERDEARQALAERKSVERAKRLLMSQHGLSEHEAYERLRITAMQRGQRMVDVAGAVLAFAKGEPGEGKRR